MQSVWSLKISVVKNAAVWHVISYHSGVQTFFYCGQMDKKIVAGHIVVMTIKRHQHQCTAKVTIPDSRPL